MVIMLFTEEFKIVKDGSDNWFNPILTYDTRLFVDPFLIFETENQDFVHGHGKFISFFNHAFELIAKSGGDTNSTYYRQALGLLMFPEVDELCLGFARNSTKGLGSGNEYSKLIADAIWISIQSGISQISHFEELSIFNEGIGADRISDMTANLFKTELISYTQSICEKHSIEMREQQVVNTTYSLDLNRWFHKRVKLPYNKYTKQPIILVPEEFLSPLPSINHEDFLDYVFTYENDILRESLSHFVKSKINKAEIVAIARSHIATVERYVKRKEKQGAFSYNLGKDRQVLYKWYSEGKSFVEKNPLEITSPNTEKDFLNKVNEIVNVFKHFIEYERGYLLLYDDLGNPMSEKAVQRLFWGIVIHYCKANNIICSPEVDYGSGPVDFEFSNGYKQRLLLETKLANNTRVWNGLRGQLPQYLETAKIINGIFLIVAYNRLDLYRINNKISQEITNVAQITGKHITYLVIDASRKLSASRQN